MEKYDLFFSLKMVSLAMLFQHIVICRYVVIMKYLQCVLVYGKKSKDNRSHFLAQNRVHYSVDFIFLSFGIMGFIVEL